MSNTSFIYILTNDLKTAFHVDTTNDIKRRIGLHATKPMGIVKDRKVHHLVLLEEVADMKAAIDRKKEVKKMSKDEKIALISKENPSWKFLEKAYL